MSSLDENLRIFEEERRRTGLQDTPIQLEIAENPPTELMGDAVWDLIKLIAELIRKDIMMVGEGRPYAVLRDNGYVISVPERYSHDPERFRGIVIHELGHIANGDCDKNYPWPLNYLVYQLYEERKARKYAQKMGGRLRL